MHRATVLGLLLGVDSSFDHFDFIFEGLFLDLGQLSLFCALLLRLGLVDLTADSNWHLEGLHLDVIARHFLRVVEVLSRTSHGVGTQSVAEHTDMVPFA